MKLCINSALRCASKGAGYLERRGVEGCKHVQRAGEKKKRSYLETQGQQTPMTG